MRRWVFKVAGDTLKVFVIRGEYFFRNNECDVRTRGWGSCWENDLTFLGYTPERNHRDCDI